MSGSGEDTAEDNPQIGSGSELGTHDGTEDRACSGNVEELNHEDLPVGQYNVVQSVGLGHGGCYAVVGSEHPLYEASVEEIANNQSHEAHSK